ncbi:MAG TPA: toll/interleukin-1 receptor domain-containing protein, partial [Rhizomicrobium sp.]|nr:toll/interleukin-1 receptor domain-containing protein [Rhizomicrobium sp.]
MLALCNRLREHGIDAFVDQFLPGAPSEGWPLWMERQIEQRDFTLMICTQSYLSRFMETEPRGVGRGVVWEARILRNLLYQDTTWHARIIPVLLAPDADAFIPTVFRGNFYDVSGARGFESLLHHLLQKPVAEAQALGSLGAHGSRWSAFERPWLVPDVTRTGYFTGREQVLAQLRTDLLERHRAALSGLGGVGKTQTAIEYAVRHRDEYPHGVFWVNAETTGGLMRGFGEIATALHLSASDQNDQDKLVKATLAWMDANDGWLLILDNVEDRREVRRFMPTRGKGDALITSRQPVLAELGVPRALELRDLDREDGVRFLLMRTGRENAGPDDRCAAAELATELENFPLALEQAAAYIAETNAAFSAYLSAFRERRVALLEKSGDLLSHDTVAVTWAANFEAVQSASHAAAELLRVSALFAPDAIPFELFLKGGPTLGEALASALTDGDELSMGEVL